MAYKSALDVWRESGQESRQNRTQMQIGERGAALEFELGDRERRADMSVNRPRWIPFEWMFAPKDPAQPEPG